MDLPRPTGGTIPTGRAGVCCVKAKNRLDNACLNGHHQGMKDREGGSGRRRFDSLEQEAYLNLWRTYDRLKHLEDELFGGFELTAQQYNALRLLRAAHPKRVPTLIVASRLISKAPDITRLLDRLEERGFIVRERLADDRRTVGVGITRAGVSLLDQMAGAVGDCHEKQLGHLSPDELETLTELLRKARRPLETEGSAWR
jgi:DNA-binding MarR family transcriptional regulator